MARNSLQQMCLAKISRFKYVHLEIGPNFCVSRRKRSLSKREVSPPHQEAEVLLTDPGGGFVGQAKTAGKKDQTGEGWRNEFLS